MIRNMLIGVLSYGLPLIILSFWALSAMNADEPNMLFFYAVGLPVVLVTVWLVTRGTPSSVTGMLALLLVSPVAAVAAALII